LETTTAFLRRNPSPTGLVPVEFGLETTTALNVTPLCDFRRTRRRKSHRGGVVAAPGSRQTGFRRDKPGGDQQGRRITQAEARPESVTTRRFPCRESPAGRVCADRPDGPLFFKSRGNFRRFLQGPERPNAFRGKRLRHGGGVGGRAATELFSAPSLAPCRRRIGRVVASRWHTPRYASSGDLDRAGSLRCN